MKLTKLLVEAVSCGNGEAAALALELLGKIKIVDLTDEQAEKLASYVWPQNRFHNRSMPPLEIHPNANASSIEELTDKMVCKKTSS